MIMQYKCYCMYCTDICTVYEFCTVMYYNTSSGNPKYLWKNLKIV